MAVPHETTTQVGTVKSSPPDRFPLAISASEITPIVFCASLVPCASATIEDDATCAQRKPRSARSAAKFLINRYTITVAPSATTPARTGAISAGTITFASTPSPWTAENPTEATAAPIMPPISACDDDDGTPNHHVTRFQVIAPIRPAKIAVVVMTPASTMPLATVAATVIEMKAPAKLRIAATPTATFGFSAPVAMVVAIALAVSWKPFVKSNTSATATTRTMMMSPVTDDDHMAVRGDAVA